MYGYLQETVWRNFQMKILPWSKKHLKVPPNGLLEVSIYYVKIFPIYLVMFSCFFLLILIGSFYSSSASIFFFFFFLTKKGNIKRLVFGYSKSKCKYQQKTKPLGFFSDFLVYMDFIYAKN